MASTTHITVRISPDLKEKLLAFAKAERRTLSQFVAIQLEQVIEQLEKKNPPR